MDKPLVSVWMITYNHEKFLAEALDSVLMQKTNFPFEIVIGEDCSTDGTRAILKDYESKYPNIIKPIYQEKNVGAMRNAYEFALPQCKGKYIACLEGDDYWTDPLKLQKQIDFLESNSEFSACAHEVLISSPHSDVKVFSEIHKKSNPGRKTIIDALQGIICHTSSVVFRNYLIEFPVWHKDIPAADYTMSVLLTQKNDIFVLEDQMSLYRYNPTSITSSGGEIGYGIKSQYLYISREKKINILLDKKYNKIINTQIAYYFLVIYRLLKREGKILAASLILFKIIYYDISVWKNRNIKND